MNTLVIEKQTGGYFKFTLNGDTANAITSIQNDLLAVGTQLHFKTGNGANIIKEQFIYPADVTIIASGTFTFTTVAQVWDKLIDIDYFAWLGGGGTGGVDRFDDLLDTFSYTGNAGKAVVVDGSELRLVPITLYNKRLFTELEDTPNSLVPNKMLVVNPAGTAVVLQDQPEQPEQLLNSVGYFDYNDLATQTTPLTVVANVALKLTNDTEGANTSTDQNPYGVSYVWDYTTNQFNFNELEVGDTIDVRVHVQVTTTSANQRVLLSAKFGIGSVAEFTNIIYENQFKTAGLHEVNFVAPFYMGSNDITDNPAELYLTTDASATVKVDGWYVRILRKNINIITVDYTVPDATTTVKGIVRLAGDLAGTANSPTVPELANKVPTSRTVSTTSPLLGGGALSSNLTLSIQQANSVDSGYLSNVDWSTFNAKANDSAVVHKTGDETITGKKTFDSSAGSSDAIEIISNSTGYGINLSHPSGGTAIFISNPVGVGLNVNNIGTNSFGISISNPSTGRAIDISNGGAGTGIYYSNSHTGNGIYSNNAAAGVGFYSNNASTGQGIHSINNSTGIGILSNNNLGGTGINSINSSTGNGINSLNTGSGIGIGSTNNSTGSGIYSINQSTGKGIYAINSSSGQNLVLNNTTAATGMPFTIQKNGTDKFTINDAGEATGVKFIKSGGTSSQFLKADGSIDSTSYQAALTNPVTGTGTTNYFPKFTGASSLGNSVVSETPYGINVQGTNGGDTLVLDKPSGASVAFKVNGVYTGQIGAVGNDLYVGSKSIYPAIVVKDGGNVGIGTTSPDNGKLTILKNTSRATESSYGIAIQSNALNAYTELLLGADDTVDCGVIQTAGKNTSFTSKKLALQPQGGNVGIGTTSPSTLLTISGLAPTFTINRQPTGTQPKISYTDNGSEFAYIQPSAASSVMRYDMGPSAGWGGIHAFYTDTTEKMRITSNGELLIGRTSSYGAGWQLAVEGNIYAKNDLRIDANASFGGNVGIGTTSPSAKLDVRTGAVGTLVNFTDGIAQTFQVGTTASGIDISNPNSGYISFSNTAERMRITSGGNLLVGITTDAGYKLDVNGTGIFRNSLQATTLKINTSTERGKVNIETSLPWGTKTNDVLNFTSYGYAGDVYTEHNAGSIKWWSGDQQVVGITAWRNIPASGDVFDLAFSTNPGGNNLTERMRITSGGNVGIGTTSPSFAFGSGLHVKSNSGWGEIRIEGQSFAGGTGSVISFTSEGTALADIYADTDKNLSFRTNGASERMRITSGGNLCIGTTSTTLSTTSVSAAFGVGGDATLKLGGYGGSTHTQVQFIHTGSVQGSIVTTNGAGTAYNTSSDYRLKEDLKPINGLDLISQINVYDYKWKSNETRAYGVLAHELQEVIPQAVSGEKDSENMQGVDYSKLVPILVQAIQELKQEIEILKNK